MILFVILFLFTINFIFVILAECFAMAEIGVPSLLLFTVLSVSNQLLQGKCFQSNNNLITLLYI